jgi:hypothetical protein
MGLLISALTAEADSSFTSWPMDTEQESGAAVGYEHEAAGSFRGTQMPPKPGSGNPRPCGLRRFCRCPSLRPPWPTAALPAIASWPAHVSHQRAAIHLGGQDHVVEDLGSLNGTWLNAQPGTPPLRHGDRLSFADVEAEFQLSVPQPLPSPRVAYHRREHAMQTTHPERSLRRDLNDAPGFSAWAPSPA